MFGNETTIDKNAFPKEWLQQQNTIGQSLLQETKDFEKATNIFKSAYEFALEENLADEFIELKIGYGISLYKNGDMDNSQSILSEALPKIDDSSLKLKAEVNQILGMILVFKNKFADGYSLQMDALKFYSTIGDSTGLMSVYYDLGGNFGTQAQGDLALENYEKGITIARELGDAKNIILGITAIGGTYGAMEEYEKSLEYIDESIELAKEIDDTEELAWASINKGHVLGRMENYQKAEFYLKQAYDLSFQIGNKLLTAYSLEQLSDIFIQQNLLEKAIEKLDESQKIYNELGQTNSEKEVIRKYAEISFQQKDFEKYKSYTDKYIAIKDSLFSKEMTESMADLKQDFEIHELEREKEIELLIKDQELSNVRSQVTIAIVAGFTIIFFLLLTLMYHRNKSALEKNNILREKNDEIIRQNEILASSNRDLEKFAYIISHDLKEPLRNIHGFTSLMNRKLKKYDLDESIEEYSGYITGGIQQMADLLSGLLEYSKIGVNKGEMETVDINELVTQVTNNFRIQQKEKNCNIDIADLPNLVCRRPQMIQVFQNLIANALKFSNKNINKITIGTKDLDKEYCIFIKDQGIGIDPKYQKGIFEVFKRLHNRGEYSGSGIGLATCKKIVEDHGGRIWVESEEGKGSCFYFTIPKDPNRSIEMSPDTKIEKKERKEELEMV